MPCKPMGRVCGRAVNQSYTLCGVVLCAQLAMAVHPTNATHTHTHTHTHLRDLFAFFALFAWRELLPALPADPLL